MVNGSDRLTVQATVVKVYTITTCHYCEKTVEFLNSHGIEFEIVNLDELSGKAQVEAIARAYRLSGQRSFPVTDINGTGVVGLDIGRFSKLLAISPEEPPQKTVTLKQTADGRDIEDARVWAAKMGYPLSSDEELLKTILSGLLKNEHRYGYRSCPCRVSTGVYDRDCDIICPCAYREGDMALYGRCYCGLYVTEEFISSGAKLAHIPEAREPAPSAGEKESKKELGEQLACELQSKRPDSGASQIIKVFAYFSGRDERESSKDEFVLLAQALEIDGILWHGEAAEGSREMPDGGRISLRFLQGMYEHIFILSLSPGDSKDIYDKVLDNYTGYLKGKRNEMFLLDIFAGGLTGALPSTDFKGQRLRDGTVIISDYEPLTHVREYRFLTVDTNNNYQVVDDIIRIESCYNLLLSQRQKYILLADKLGSIEEGISTTMGVINLNISGALGDILKEWLYFLSTNFGEVAGVAEELKKHAADTEGRRSLLHSILDKWGEEPLTEGGITISAPLLSYTKGLGDDYGRLIQRIEGLKRELGDMINILRTRVDIIQQEQSLEIQKSMHETSRTQLKMQRAVESLEILIVTYYMTDLSKLIFRAIESSGRYLPYSPEVMAAYLIPVFFAFAIFISGKIGHFFETVISRIWGGRHDRQDKGH